MRKVTDGNGNDSTAAVAAYLAAGNSFRIANLYLLGDLESPFTYWLTDYEAPLVWSFWGKFNPAVIKRGTVGTKIGLEVSTLDITWSPPIQSATQGYGYGYGYELPAAPSISTASPYQLARLGHYDGWIFRSWSVYMPTPGDANTFGASELFGGRIQDTTIERGAIKFTINSFLDVVNQMVPTNVIELTNTLASYAGATPPAGLAATPNMNVVAGSTPTVIFCQSQAPNFNKVFVDHTLIGGYIVFNVGGTLDLLWSAIQDNFHETVGGVIYNQLILYAPLPWAPTPGVDTFYISAQAPTDGTIEGFPYIPAPSSVL